MNPGGLSSVGISVSRPAADAYTAPGELVCPDCAMLLRQDDTALACPKCRRDWPVIDGTPHFVGDFPYWGEIPLEEMREVNRRAAIGSWKAPLLDSPNPVVRTAAEMILNLERANWQWLIDLPPDSRALDLGAGMGTNSHALGLHYREVVAVEPVLERVRFMQQRFSQERLSNVKIVRSSVWDLPFAQESFDLVAMNGVLEWVPEGFTEDPRELQKRALKKVYGLLRPGGYFYLGIENRLSLGHFIGCRDPHCSLPFVTVLPRPLAHWQAKRKGLANGYRNYLYSNRGYRKLLGEVGFTRPASYVALPSYNHPRFLMPVEDNIFSYYLNNFNQTPARTTRRIARWILLKSGLLKHTQYSFVILARK